MAETTFDFRWRKTPPFLDLHIARLAIMWALVLGKHKKPDWPKAMAAALLLWRKRVSALHALGWRQAAHPARLRNCYPSMFTLTEEPPVHYSC